MNDIADRNRLDLSRPDIQRAWIDGLTLMDDAYMAFFFQDEPQCAQEVIRRIIGRDDLQVESVSTHYDIPGGLNTRGTELDVYAVDHEGQIYNIELQRRLDRANPKRARYYASVIDTHALAHSHNFEELPQVWVIFICNGDALKHDEPISTFERLSIQSGRHLDDGTHIVYLDAPTLANNSDPNDADHALSDLMRDILSANPDTMRIKRLAGIA